MRDNGQSQMAQEVRQESEFIKRIEDFARYMAPEYITDSDNTRSLTIIAADCLDAKQGRCAMAHIMLGNDRVGRCALRSMMNDNDTFSSLVHELCDDDGSRSVEELDEEIGRRQKRMTHSLWAAVGIATWSGVLIVLSVAGLAHWLTTVSSLLLMAFTGMLIGRDVRSLRADIEKLRQQRKRAAGRQRIVNGISKFAEFLRQMRASLEEDAGDDDDD